MTTVLNWVLIVAVWLVWLAAGLLALGAALNTYRDLQSALLTFSFVSRHDRLVMILLYWIGLAAPPVLWAVCAWLWFDLGQWWRVKL